MSYTNTNQSSGTGIIRFQGNNEPNKPDLKWFKHDENMTVSYTHLLYVSYYTEHLQYD